MNLLRDAAFLRLAAGALIFLAAATAIGRVLRWRQGQQVSATIDNLNDRINAWWVMVAVISVAILTGGLGSYVLFTITSFLALREFITLIPTSRADHRALFWAFFVITPLQYVLVAFKAYGLFTLMIPVYGFLFIMIRIVLAGDARRFMERSAAVLLALMICVYSLSFAPALLTLNVPGFAGQGAKLLLFLVIVDQFSDVFQYIFGKLFGRHQVSPQISPNKTWEGLIGGVSGATLLGAAIWWATPFTVFEATGLAFIIALMGFFGGLVMSAIKRDRGIKDFGTFIRGHGGILDRIDSLAFAAPIFFQLTRLLAGA
jgi:phosphatidate cytidylyltransferase